MLVTEEIIARWVMLSILFGAAAWFVIDSLLHADGRHRVHLEHVPAARRRLAVRCCGSRSPAPLFLAIVAESSEGHDGCTSRRRGRRSIGSARRPISSARGDGGGRRRARDDCLADGVADCRLRSRPPLAACVCTRHVSARAIWGRCWRTRRFGVISPRLIPTLLSLPRALAVVLRRVGDAGGRRLARRAMGSCMTGDVGLCGRAAGGHGRRAVVHAAARPAGVVAVGRGRASGGRGRSRRCGRGPSALGRRVGGEAPTREAELPAAPVRQVK